MIKSAAEARVMIESTTLADVYAVRYWLIETSGPTEFSDLIETEEFAAWCERNSDMIESSYVLIPDPLDKQSAPSERLDQVVWRVLHGELPRPRTILRRRT